MDLKVNKLDIKEFAFLLDSPFFFSSHSLQTGQTINQFTSHFYEVSIFLSTVHSRECDLYS